MRSISTQSMNGVKSNKWARRAAPIAPAVGCRLNQPRVAVQEGRPDRRVVHNPRSHSRKYRLGFAGGLSTGYVGGCEAAGQT